MASIMYDYICETPQVLAHIMDRRAKICSEFVETFRDKEVKELYIIGSGTSYHAGVSAKPYIEEATGWKVTPMYPTRFSREEKIYGEGALVIGISQGGQSLSTVEGLDAATEAGLMTAAVSENPTALVFEHAQVKVLLEVGNEKCGAKTKGYAGSIMTVMMMATELALAKGIMTEDAAASYRSRMAAVIKNLPTIIDAGTTWYERINDDLLPAKRIIVVGYEGMYGDVLEGALKILETVRQGVCGYDIEEFFHGIYNSINEDSYLFYLASAGDYKPRTVKLIDILSEWTSHNYLIGSSEGLDVPGAAWKPGAFDCIAPFIDDTLFSCWEYILPLQIVSCMGAQAHGVDPSIPKDPLFHKRIGSKELDGVRDNYVAGETR